MVGSVRYVTWSFSVSETPANISSKLNTVFNTLSSLVPDDLINVADAKNQTAAKLALIGSSKGTPNLTFSVSHTGPVGVKSQVYVSVVTNW